MIYAFSFCIWELEVGKLGVIKYGIYNGVYSSYVRSYINKIK